MPQSEGRCLERKRLKQAADALLLKLVELTTAQHETFISTRQPEFKRLDKELENTVGAQERAFGLYRQHIQEHGC